MQIVEAAEILKRMYETAPEGEKAVSIHLFGIKYASDIASMSIREIVVRAGLPESYATEVRKGINLAKHVKLME